MRAFSTYPDFTVVSTATLELPPTTVMLTNLAPAEIEQYNYWKPSQIGDASLTTGIETAVAVHLPPNEFFYAKQRLRPWSIIRYAMPVPPFSHFGLLRRGHRLFGSVHSLW